MSYDPRIHHRRSIRLQGYDYSQDGMYYVTLVAQGRARLFGEVLGGEMRLSEYGEIVADAWEWLARQYPYVELGIWVVMPDHLHGIIVLQDVCKGGSRAALTQAIEPPGELGAERAALTQAIESPGELGAERAALTQAIEPPGELGAERAGSITTGLPPIPVDVSMARSRLKRKPLGELIGAFKTVSTKNINLVRGTPGVTAWQRNYYEHIVRNSEDYNRIHRYIENNPAAWAETHAQPGL